MIEFSRGLSVDYRSIFRFIAFIMLFIAVVMTIPLMIAYTHSETTSFKAFMQTIAAMSVFSLSVIAATNRRKEMNIGPKEAMLVVSLTWIVMTAFGALPLYLSGSVHSYSACFFEIMSGFTTAGSTVLTDIETLDMSILFWRGMTNWLGGMGVVILFVAVLPIFGVRGNALVGAEAVGPSKSKFTPTIRGTAMALWMIYIGLSIVQTILLLLCGLDLFNALSVMFGTMGAAGFAPLNDSIAGYNSTSVEWVCIVFMLLAGVNFSLFFFVLRGQLRKAAGNGELRLYLTLILVATLLVSVQLISKGVYSSIPDTLRESLFHVVSMITTTGFVADDFNLWPMFSQMILFSVCCVGACSGSAGGGMKVVRIAVMLRLAYNSMLKRFHPNAVSPVMLGTDQFDDKSALSIAGYAGCYFATLFIGSVVIAMTDQDFMTCFMSVFLCLGNLGTGIGGMGSSFSFNIFPSWALWVFSFLMLLGRLEFYTVFTLFTRSFWKR